jgi:hypothetical protein
MSKFIYPFKDTDYEIVLWKSPPSREVTYRATLHRKLDHVCELKSDIYVRANCPFTSHTSSGWETWHEAVNYPLQACRSFRAELGMKDIRTFKRKVDEILKSIYEDHGGSTCLLCGEHNCKLNFTTSMSELVCETCAADEIKICYVCHRSTPARLAELGEYLGRVVLVCKQCLLKRKRCSRCDSPSWELHQITLGQNTTSTNWCKICTIDYAQCCQECGRRWPLAVPFRNLLCPFCSGAKKIRNYSDDVLRFCKPFGTSPQLYGVELELEVKNEHSVESCVEYTIDTLGEDFCILKRDGTICRGFEIVTAPAEIPIHIDKWKKFFDGVKNTALSARSNCGMHVHISRNPLRRLQIGKAVVFLNNSRNEQFITKLAGRYSSGGGYPNFNKKVTSRGESKYEMLNLVSRKPTVECRIFASTTDRLQFYANLEFCEALLRFSKEYGVRNMEGKYFIQYISSKGEWKNLYDLLVLRGLITDTNRFSYLTRIKTGA